MLLHIALTKQMGKRKVYAAFAIVKFFSLKICLMLNKQTIILPVQ